MKPVQSPTRSSLISLVLLVVMTLGAFPSAAQGAELACYSATQVVVAPPPGVLYHGVFPGGVTGAEDDISDADVASYETTVGKQVAWVYFSNNWGTSRKFPRETAEMIRARGAVPYVRLMLRQSAENPCPDPVFGLNRIAAGRFDCDLKKWAQDARDFGTPLIVEFGTEVNGDWFCWNGRWNGGGRLAGFGDRLKADGPERFRYAYRRIVQLMRNQGAKNIVWVFHVNWDRWPDVAWNSYRQYYPGDSYVDWLAISAYGAQSPLDAPGDISAFRPMIDHAYAGFTRFNTKKPIVICEFATDGRNPGYPADIWAQEALDDLTDGRWPRVIGFSWWNERWENDEEPAHDTIMRVQELPALAGVFANTLEAQKDGLAFRPICGWR